MIKTPDGRIYNAIRCRKDPHNPGEWVADVQIFPADDPMSYELHHYRGSGGRWEPCYPDTPECSLSLSYELHRMHAGRVAPAPLERPHGYIFVVYEGLKIVWHGHNPFGAQRPLLDRGWTTSDGALVPVDKAQYVKAIDGRSRWVNGEVVT